MLILQGGDQRLAGVKQWSCLSGGQGVRLKVLGLEALHFETTFSRMHSPSPARESQA
jgi:hypothetical protein